MGSKAGPPRDHGYFPRFLSSVFFPGNHPLSLFHLTHLPGIPRIPGHSSLSHEPCPLHRSLRYVTTCLLPTHWLPRPIPSFSKGGHRVVSHPPVATRGWPAHIDRTTRIAVERSIQQEERNGGSSLGEVVVHRFLKKFIDGNMINLPHRLGRHHSLGKRLDQALQMSLRISIEHVIHNYI